MKSGPDIALVAALIGDPARANMLTALSSGAALTAGELAQEAGVSAQTASSHLAKLAGGGLIRLRRQGRHRYYALSGEDVGQVLEALMGLAARNGQQRTRPGPREPELRQARVCYDHLAGDMGVAMFEAMIADGRLGGTAEDPLLTNAGETFVRSFGIDLDALRRSRRPLCRGCLDWSVRRSHLAGALGAALLTQMQELGWAARRPESRILTFSARGRAGFSAQLLGVPA